MNTVQQIIILPTISKQELRSSLNLIFNQEEKDCAVEKEVIPMEHE